MLSIWSGAERIVEPELNQRIQIHLQRTGVRGVEALLVPSHQRWAGAAIVGAIPGFRKLWLGDATIELLNDRELDMVILHELSHVQRRHFLWRMLPILFIAWLVACVWAAVPAMVSHAATQAVVQLALLSLAGGLLVATLGNLAKLCEFDADRYACQLAKRSCEWSDSIAPGLVLASALARLIPADSPAALTTWLHPSLADRLEQLMLQPG